MTNPNTTKKIAVLIDADNAPHNKIKAILDEVALHGHIVTKRAYGDWTLDALKRWPGVLNEHSILPVQQFAYTKQKNATDICLVIDAMDMLYSNRYDTFVIVSSDSDFTRLVSRLRESERYVMGFGRITTPTSFRNTCDNFVLIENLGQESAETEQAAAECTDNEPASHATQSATECTADAEAREAKRRVKELVSTLKQAHQAYQDNTGWVTVCAVGAFVKRTIPDFDPRSFECKSLSDVLYKLEGLFEVNTRIGKNDHLDYVYRPVIQKQTIAPLTPNGSPVTLPTVIQALKDVFKLLSKGHEWVPLSSAGSVLKQMLPELNLADFGHRSLSSFLLELNRDFNVQTILGDKQTMVYYQVKVSAKAKISQAKDLKVA